MSAHSLPACDSAHDNRSVILTVVLSYALCLLPTSIALGGEAALNVTGTWSGPFFTRGNSGECTLVLAQDGASVNGTIQCTNTSAGPGAQPILDGRLVGERLTFTSKGQDGSVFQADFTAKATEIAGWGIHETLRGRAHVEFKFHRK